MSQDDTPVTPEMIRRHCTTSHEADSYHLLLKCVEEFGMKAAQQFDTTVEQWEAAQDALDALRRALGGGPVIQHLTYQWLSGGIRQLQHLISNANAEPMKRRWSFNQLLCDNPDLRVTPLSDETIRHSLNTTHLGVDDFHRLTHLYWTALRDATSTAVLATEADVETMAALLRGKFLASCVVVSPPGQRRHDKVRYDGLCTFYNFEPPKGRYHGLENMGACWSPGTVA